MTRAGLCPINKIATFAHTGQRKALCESTFQSALSWHIVLLVNVLEHVVMSATGLQKTSFALLMALMVYVAFVGG